MADVTILDRGFRIPAYHVEAIDRTGPRPGVVLVHDILGMGDDMREQADWLATAGFDVVMPDLYSRSSRATCVPRTMRALMAREGDAWHDIRAARQWLLDRPGGNGRIGVLGFCMGGAFALLLAAGPDQWDAAAPNYGLVPDDVDEVLSSPCPLVASYGGRDRAIPDGAARITHALAAGNTPHDVKEYPDAGHSFMNRIAVRSPLGPLLRVAGVGYHHDSAMDARRRIVTFFNDHLDLDES